MTLINHERDSSRKNPYFRHALCHPQTFPSHIRLHPPATRVYNRAIRLQARVSFSAIIGSPATPILTVDDEFKLPRYG